MLNVLGIGIVRNDLAADNDLESQTRKTAQAWE
jgi:hypothetical protein